MWDGYVSYAICILVVSIGSITIGLYETLKNNEQVRLMSLYSCPVLRLEADQSKALVDSTELVPGDIIEVPEGKSLPCDLILLTGGAIVNESMLTGESVPVLKASLPLLSDEAYSTKLSGKYTLHGGTQVV